MFPITVKYSTFARFQADVAIHGNNEADTAAKSALEFEIVKFKIPSTDLKHFIKLYINSLWQIFWDFVIQVNHILFKIKLTYYIILILNAATKL